MLGNLIGGFIVIVVGTVLLPVIANQIVGTEQNASGSTVGYNVTGASAAIANLVIVFYALAIATVAISIAVVGMKNSGIM